MKSTTTDRLAQCFAGFQLRKEGTSAHLQGMYLCWVMLLFGEAIQTLHYSWLVLQF